MADTIPKALTHKGKKRRSKKKALRSDVLPTVESKTTVPPVTSTTDADTATNIKNEKIKRLHQKMEQLKSRRTGNERRQQMKTFKETQESQGKKPKNAMRNVAREGIHELLNKVGVNDPKVESEIMNEIVRGTLRTPTQVAEFVVQKLQKLFPNGPVKKQPTHSIPVPPISQTQPPSSDLPPPSINAVPASNSDIKNPTSGRKPLKHPSPSLIIGTAK